MTYMKVGLRIDVALLRSAVACLLFMHFQPGVLMRTVCPRSGKPFCWIRTQHSNTCTRCECHRSAKSGLTTSFDV